MDIQETPPTMELSPLTPELCDRGFGIDHVRDNILRFVVQESVADVPCTRTLTWCRLVQRAWYESVNRNLVESKIALVHFRWGNGTLEELLRSDFVKFLRARWSTFHWAKFMTTFNLAVSFLPNGLREAHVAAIIEHMQWGNRGLVNLFVQPVLDRRGDPLIRLGDPRYPPLSLPVLDNFTLNLEDSPVLQDSDLGNFTLLVPYILSRCERLASFRLSCLQGSQKLSGSELIGSLMLPETVTKLEVMVALKQEQLRRLMRNQRNLKLTYLVASTPSPLEDGHPGILHKILDMFKDTLKFFCIMPGRMEDAREEIRLDLPVMTCLETFCSVWLKLRLPQSNLEGHLPALREIKMNSGDVAMVRNWTENSRFERVTELHLNFWFTSQGQGTEVLTLELSQRLSASFPGITKLTVATRVEDGVSLQYLFRNMPHLQFLCLKVGTPMRPDPHFLDALLMGASFQAVTALEGCREIWKGLELKPEEFQSVANLKELRELQVLCITYHPNDEQLSFSDVVFELVLLRMHQLQRLKLDGIGMSPEMVERWEREGRHVWRNGH